MHYFSKVIDTYARCTQCCSDFTVSHDGLSDVTTHVLGKQHKEMAKASSSSRSIVSMFKPKVSEGAITSEALRAMFVVKHNLMSDHANKLFNSSLQQLVILCNHNSSDAIQTEIDGIHLYILESTLRPLEVHKL